MTNVERDQLNVVRVAFADAALSFGLPKRATLQDLAEEVCWLGRHYGTKPLFVEVRVRRTPMRKAFDA